MTAFLLLVAAIAALVDWYAVAVPRPELERIAKPATMAALIAVAAVAGGPADSVRLWLVVGACFGLIGDVALLGQSSTSFLAGLGAFAIGHLAYVAAAWSFGHDSLLVIVAAVFVVALFAFRFVTQTVPGAFGSGGRVLGGAVIVYAAVISAMILSAGATGLGLALLGAMLFSVSDWVIGYDRFVEPVPNRGLVVMVPYHLGQTLLILALAFG